MVSVVSLYQQLFGRKGPSIGADIDMAEHGRVGGLSTGQPFKFISPIDQDTGAKNPLPTGAATEAKQLADNHQVTVSNIASTPVITGFATSAKQDNLLTELQLKADLTESQPVDVQAISTIYNGTKTVPTGTAEAIAISQAVRSVTIKALSTNTVAVYVGATGCTVAAGFELLAGESVSLDVNNLNLVYCISGSASQVVRYIAV